MIDRVPALDLSEPVSIPPQDDRIPKQDDRVCERMRDRMREIQQLLSIPRALQKHSDRFRQMIQPLNTPYAPQNKALCSNLDQGNNQNPHIALLDNSLATVQPTDESAVANTFSPMTQPSVIQDNVPNLQAESAGLGYL
ncbi:hypothetical protein MMC07_008117 [Pseudocyphellaria aurata]|nr:hypothetical protein [Pseudocyphellaria aurata]